jgi:hypothetical protein
MINFPFTGVWISARAATVLLWSPEESVVHHLDSTVPPRHRSTGSAPTQKHAAGEGRRDEHLRLFFTQVAALLPLEGALLLLGDGEVVEHFAAQIRTQDEHHSRRRRIEIVKTGPLSERQLAARVRLFAGLPPQRQRPAGARVVD